MNAQELLSICIPTFNRSEMLKNNVLELIEEIRPFNLPVIISDNNSTDDTLQTVAFLKTIYPNITYFKQDENISDLNFIFVLNKAKTRYAWLLGDKNRIIPGALGELIKSINEIFYDAIIVNYYPGRVRSVPSRNYQQPIDLLNDLGWHTTMISSLIFSKAMVEKNLFERYAKTKFMHVAALFDFIADKECNVLWVSKPVIQGPCELMPNPWLRDVFSIFIESWINTIFSLSPNYPFGTKLKVIKQHGIDAKVFIFERFLFYRSKKVYNFKYYIKYRYYFSLITNVPRFILLLISIIPSWLFGSLYFLLDVYRKTTEK